MQMRQPETENSDELIASMMDRLGVMEDAISTCE
jgi:hypothetical protein